MDTTLLMRDVVVGITQNRPESARVLGGIMIAAVLGALMWVPILLLIL